MNITLKDGSVITFENAVTVAEVAKSISEGLARVAVCAICGYSRGGRKKDEP